jgi:aryl-alcohol dehydrogenase-like predicted oxidoreductase
MVRARRRQSGKAEFSARRHRASARRAPGSNRARLLQRSLVMLPIPSTANAANLQENVAAGIIRLTTEEFNALDRDSKARRNG